MQVLHKTIQQLVRILCDGVWFLCAKAVVSVRKRAWKTFFLQYLNKMQKKSLLKFAFVLKYYGN